MKRTIVLLAFLSAAAWLTAAPESLPSPIPVDEAAVKKWRDARFGMFIHWGPVSLKGTEIGWSRGNQVPVEEYDSLYKKFDPVKFNADEWVGVAKAAGMKYIVLTTKHHDGFCLWDTKETGHNIMNSPFKRDVVKELAEACKKQGIAFGTYYSTCDWYHPDFPVTSPGGKTVRPVSNLDRYTDYLKAQVTELLTQYGPLFTLWFDVPQKFDAARGQGIINMARKIQPDIVINNRTGAKGDYDTPEQHIGGFQIDRPWETCMTICNQWAWKPNDSMKSLKQCLQTLIQTNGGDGNLLFNVGPEPTGVIEARQIERLKEMGAWLDKYGASIYGTRGGPYKPTKTFVTTRKGNTIYLHILKWPEGADSIMLPPLPAKITRSKLLTGGTVSVDQSDAGVKVTVPASDRQDIDTLVQLDLAGSAMDIEPITVTGKNPLAGGKASASNVFGNKEEFGAAKAFDGNPDSRWAADAGLTSAWLEVVLAKPVTFTGFEIEEASGSRVKEFEFQVKEGDAWKTVLTGKKIGPDFTSARFPAVTADTVRLNILKSTDGPTISEIRLTNDK